MERVSNVEKVKRGVFKFEVFLFTSINAAT